MIEKYCAAQIKTRLVARRNETSCVPASTKTSQEAKHFCSALDTGSRNQRVNQGGPPRRRRKARPAYLCILAFAQENNPPSHSIKAFQLLIRRANFRFAVIHSPSNAKPMQLPGAQQTSVATPSFTSRLPIQTGRLVS